jgi:Family of unknown function (DUF6411)
MTAEDRGTSRPEIQRMKGIMMVIAGIAVVCVVLLVLAFVAPRLSRRPQNGTQRVLGHGSRAGGSAPGGLGRLLSKPFRSSSRAVGRSGSTGRRARRRLPF